MTRSLSTGSADVPGIPLDAVAFYEDLGSSNSREWWTQNTTRYAASVREPMSHLADVLADDFGEARVFRPHRDVRFSKDKTPYKEHQGVFVAVFPSMGWYVQVSAEGLRTAGGFYRSESDQVARYRAAVDDDLVGERLADLVDTLLDNGFDIGGELLRTRPRGIPADHARLELLRHRNLTASRDHAVGDWLETDEVVARVREDWEALRPLLDWCRQHVGPSEKPARR